MSRLLYITAFPPNERTGGQAFSLRAVADLAASYEVDVWYFDYPGHETLLKAEGGVRSVRRIPVGKWDFLRAWRHHPTFGRRFNPQVLKQLQQVAPQYDVLLFDFSQVALYGLYVEHPCKLLRMHDVLYQKYSRKSGLLGRWVLASERKVVKAFRKVFVPSPKDAQLLNAAYGIEADYTHEYLKPVHLPETVEMQHRFVLYGYWKRAENTDGLLWLVRSVLPLMAQRPQLLVVGGGMSPEVQAEVEAAGCRYTGFVDDPLAEILPSDAVLVPLFQGAGVKVKVIDAFTAGTPVIGTDLAFEGLPEIPGLRYQADDAQAFADRMAHFQPLTYAEKQRLSAQFIHTYDNRHLAQRIECL